MRVLNTLAHALTKEQVQELEAMNGEIHNLKDIEPELALQLSQCPDNRIELRRYAWHLIQVSEDFDRVLLPVGSPAFQFELAASIDKNANWLEWEKKFIFAHSVRESVETLETDGSVKKTNVFKHVRFF